MDMVFNAWQHVTLDLHLIYKNFIEVMSHMLLSLKPIIDKGYIVGLKKINH